MTTLVDGHVEVVTTVEPDGRIRLSVWVDGECVAAPAFARHDYSMAQITVMDEALRAEDRRTR
ncbi:hypothetical protein [Prescottella equi]|uniref:hypothetical protein n=1 Tax=Rhodococcus hoagii TaxID=43767 RepID=UPI00111C13AC|nr:hypothetical protein [Prescottella equi]